MRRRPKQESTETSSDEDDLAGDLEREHHRNHGAANAFRLPSPAHHIQRGGVIVLVLASNLLVGMLVRWLSSNGVDGPRNDGTGGLAGYLAGPSSRRLPNAGHRDGLVEPSGPVRVTPVPPGSVRTFYYDGWKVSMPIARALRSRGWSRVDDVRAAHVVYTYKQREDLGLDMRPWQRFNLIPNADLWNDKWTFVREYKRWQQQLEPGRNNMASQYIPESYMLTDNKEDTEAFSRRLKEGGGAKYPWVMKEGDVNQGRGITILAPNSRELLDVPSRALDGEFEDSGMIVQRYVCNEMTWNRRKFDVRVFWLVASLDPLIVLYHDGYVRIGNSEYTEEDFSNTVAHLTTHTKLGAEGKATFAQFEDALQEMATTKSRQLGRRTPFVPAGSSAVDHVRSQMKHALGEMISIFRDRSFVKKPTELPTDNSFSFYCADFILDNDLDVWFLEPQYGCGLDEDYYFRLEMHASLFNGMVDILEEVWQKQEEGTRKLLPLEGAGNWEVIYADGLVYDYAGYERSNDKASCSASDSKTGQKKDRPQA